jgi:hypothetical protein
LRPGLSAAEEAPGSLSDAGPDGRDDADAEAFSVLGELAM